MKKLSYLLKSSRFLYNIYYYVMSLVLKTIGLFVKCDKTLILFNSFGGKKYDDSPKAIYEKMITDRRFDSFTLVWALHDPDSVSIPGRAVAIKADSLKYFLTALRAKVWVTNSSIERGLNFKKKSTICFNTWHGTAIKLMGADIANDNQSFRSHILVRADLMLAQGQYDVEVFSRAFKLSRSSFSITGLPRNDALSAYSQNDVDEIRKRLGIGQEKKVLLYAPTFREYIKGTSNEVILDIPIDLDYWEKNLGRDYVILFRAHYEVARHMKVDGYSSFIDASSYPSLNELMIASDALISDYSSIYFDYSIMHKPVYCYAYDYDEYLQKRGMYIDLSKELPCEIHRDEESLIKDILGSETNAEERIRRVVRFQEKFVTAYGQGTDKSCDLIQEMLEKHV